MTISLSKYGPIISDKDVGEDVFNKISNALKSNDEVHVDFKEIDSMATFCAKQIFGRLYKTLGAQSFFRRIILEHANEDLKLIIQAGIENALQE